MDEAPRSGSDEGGTAGDRGKGSSWSLGLRIASGVLFVPLLVLLARAGGLAFAGFVALEVTLGLREFYRMMRGKGLHPYPLLGLLCGLGVVWKTFRPHQSQSDLLLTGAVLLTLGLGLRRPELKGRIEGMAVTLFGVLYGGWLSAHLVLLRELPWRAGTPYADGAAYVLLAFLLTWSCDTAAYAVGRTFGRTRPWTRISPRKSVEGAVGGLVAAVLWEISRHVLVWYFKTLSLVNLIYGSFAGAVALLLTFEVAALILLLGAQVIAEFERCKLPQDEAIGSGFKT